MKLLKNARFVKAMIVALAVLLSLVLAVGGTVAWLTATSDTVTNTFTYGDINITLAETETDFKMVPGREIKKDPVVTVLEDSEACWLFVKVVASANYATFMDGYTMAKGWTELTSAASSDGLTKVYYRKVAASTDADQSFNVLADAVASTADVGANGSVKVLDTVTKEMLTAENFTNPTLTFTAYAVQQDNVANDAAAAWALANPTT